MDHPANIIEHFVCQFLGQWQSGLKPSLTLVTKANGQISVSYNVDTDPIPRLEEHFKGRKSGSGARHRRRKQRTSQAHEGTLVTSSSDENEVSTLPISLMPQSEFGSSGNLTSTISPLPMDSTRFEPNTPSDCLHFKASCMLKPTPLIPSTLNAVSEVSAVKCEDCGTSFDCQQELTSHVEEVSYVCEECCICFTSELNYDLHKHELHTAEYFEYNRLTPRRKQLAIHRLNQELGFTSLSINLRVLM